MTATVTTIDTTTYFQSIDGFGVTHYQPILYTSAYSAVADALWDPNKGIGLSIYNTALMVDGYGNGWPMYQDTTFTGNNLAGDFSHELQAYNRGVRTFIIRCWTPTPDPGPYTWQVSSSATGALLASKYAAFAALHTNFLSNALAAGVPWTHVSQQNEPDLTPSGYGQTSWTTAQALSFMNNNLGAAITTWGQENPSWQAKTKMTSPAIIWGETAFWTNFSSWVSAAEGNSTALGYITHYSTHQYSGGATFAPPNPCSHPIWMTEVYDQSSGSWNTTMTSAMNSMNMLYSALTTGNASAWMHWWSEFLNSTDNQGLIGTNVAQSVADWNNPTYPKRFYCLGNFSKFVRPGSKRISVTNSPSNVKILAFRAAPTTNHNMVVCCINTNSSSAALSLSISNASVIPPKVVVTPWITDANNNLVAQPPILISGGTHNISFSTTLNATSVTTFTFQKMRPVHFCFR